MGLEGGLGGELGLWIALALVPLLIGTCTAFAKISVVLGALRAGLGAEQLLPYGIVVSLAVVLTAVVMGPVGTEVYDGIVELGGPDALRGAGPERWVLALEPLADFLARNASASELDFFAELQGRSTADPFVLIPAFLITELGEALLLAVLVLVPFVLVDLIAAQVVTLAGLASAPQPLLTLPLKVLLFLAAGGWDAIVSGLVEGYV